MNPSPSFADVYARLLQRDSRAAGEVFDRFAERLIRLARSRLGARFQQKIDPEDVVQSVCKSFFLRQADGQFSVGGWDSLWSLLTVLTVRKCANQAKRFRAARRDLGREQSDRPAAGHAWEAVDREPTPEEAAVLTETVEGLMRGLHPRDREILTLSLSGKTAEEISAETGYSQRTAHRVLAHIEDHLRGLLCPEEGQSP